MIDHMTLAEIEEKHPDCYIGTFDAGMVDVGEGTDDLEFVECTDVIVWATEEDSKDDDGANAIARYLIPAS
jgi:hypothetical protein